MYVIYIYKLQSYAIYVLGYMCWFILFNNICLTWLSFNIMVNYLIDAFVFLFIHLLDGQVCIRAPVKFAHRANTTQTGGIGVSH